MKKHFIFSAILCISFLLSCHKIIDIDPEHIEDHLSEHYSNKVILDWNMAIIDAMGGVTYEHGPLSGRIHAMTHIAMHDALNAVVPVYDNYVFAERDHLADPITAMAYAAYTVLVNQMPDKEAVLKAHLDRSLQDIEDSEWKDRGMELGKKAAQAILDLRKDDGAFADPIGKVDLSDEPGVYQDEIAFAPFWKTMQLFALVRHDQSRSDPPPALNSEAYATDYNEIKALGIKEGSTRTEDQTARAHFWFELCEIGWNRIARTVVESHEPNVFETARLFALLNMAIADGYTAGWDSKFYYNFWRPFKAIQFEKDGNPNTKPDPDWESLMPTPPIPDHPSTHAALANAAATILAHMFGDNTSFTTTSSTSLTEDEKRTYSSFSQAANENADSRVLAGIHWRFASKAGQEQGNGIGHWVYTHHLKPHYK